jgi:hypothetical protein
MKRLIAGEPGFTAEEMKILAGTSPQALRHTSGTHAIAEGLPPDVCLTHWGRSSLQTTTIYVRAERQRMLRSARLFQGAQMTVAGVGLASARKRGGGLPGTTGGDVLPLFARPSVAC